MSIWNSYVAGAYPPSKSYGAKVQFPVTMKWSPPRSARTPDFTVLPTHQWSYPADSRTMAGFPRPGAVLFEIGLLLGVHLAVALAVTLILQAAGV